VASLELAIFCTIAPREKEVSVFFEMKKEELGAHCERRAVGGHSGRSLDHPTFLLSRRETPPLLTKLHLSAVDTLI
jgi:hypothetical protein